MKKYKEIRKINRDDLKILIKKHNWYSRGTDTELEALIDKTVNKLMTTENIAILAEDIKAHSELEYDVTVIMFEITRHCFSIFKVIPEE